MKKVLLILIAALLLASSALAHPGRTDANGEVKVRLSDYFGVSVYDIFFTDASTSVDFAPGHCSA